MSRLKWRRWYLQYVAVVLGGALLLALLDTQAFDHSSQLRWLDRLLHTLWGGTVVLLFIWFKYKYAKEYPGGTLIKQVNNLENLLKSNKKEPHQPPKPPDLKPPKPFSLN